MIPLGKNIKRYFSLKECAIVFIAIVVSVSVGIGVFQSLKKEVVINDNGNKVVVKTMKTTVREVLDQNRISVKAYDYVSFPLDTKLQKIKNQEITIKRAVPISVLADGQQINLMTYEDTVRDALKNSTVKLTDKDRLDGANPDDKVIKDMQIKVVRIKEELVSETVSVPFKVVNKQNSSMNKGTQKTLREGKAGIQEKLFRVVFEDGKEIAKELLKEVVVSNPIDKIVEVGTVASLKTSRGENLRYSKVLNMSATAYTASFKDTGKHPGHPQFGITYTGMKVRKGVIAVDPKVIPLGTKVYVEGVGNVPDYGYAIAADIGGAIKGNIIDLYFDDQVTVDKWGRKKVKVYILND